MASHCKILVTRFILDEVVSVNLEKVHQGATLQKQPSSGLGTKLKIATRALFSFLKFATSSKNDNDVFDRTQLKRRKKLQSLLISARFVSSSSSAQASIDRINFGIFKGKKLIAVFGRCEKNCFKTKKTQNIQSFFSV